MGLGFRDILVVLLNIGFAVALVGAVVWLVRRFNASSRTPGGHRPMAERLAELEALHQAGKLSDAEHDRQRASVISSL